MQSIKEHNLKANHNMDKFRNQVDESVCNLSKNTIWKQITTTAKKNIMCLNLYAIYQRTQSESKSQPNLAYKSPCLLCMQSIKEHNLKANHNWPDETVNCQNSVCNLSKNTIWKQITTITDMNMMTLPLYAIYQRTQSESKSQH